jgi:hypothetical protein
MHSGDTEASTNGHKPTKAAAPNRTVEVNVNELRHRIQAAIDAGERVNGVTVGRWLGVSARTGRRRLAELAAHDPITAELLVGK